VDRWKRTQYFRELPRWKQVLLENPDLFILRYFPHRIEKLEDFHLRLIHTCMNVVRGLIEYPAGHGKTTLASTLLPIVDICRDPNIRIAIIGKNDSEAEAIMSVIQAELCDNEELIRDFGPFKPEPESQKPWALGRMSVAKRTRRAKEATIAVFGSGAKTVLGYRTDKTICDDVITEKNSATPVQRAKTKDWFDLCVETGPEHMDSILTVVGTRFDPNDLYGDLEEMVNPENGEHLWKLQKEDAVADDEEHLTLWPERWPWLRLMEQKAKVGTLSFNKRYRNIAVDASRMVFREEYVRGGWANGTQYVGCLDRTYKFGTFGDNWRIVAGFDPAVGAGRSAKFCAHAVLAEASCREHDRCFWVVDMTRAQMTLPQQVNLILEKHQEYSLFKSVVEANSYQQGLFQAIQHKMNETGEQLAVEPHYTNRTNKPDPEVGVQSMSPWFEKCAVHIPWADAFSQRRMQQFVDELIMYPDSRTTDTVMAFWFAWKTLQEQAPKFGSYNRLDKNRSLRTLAKLTPGRRTIKNPYYDREAV
jgi:phage terminase large subunit-like protein